MTPVGAASAAWKSPALRATLVCGIAGAGFAGANLLLARTLPPEEFGHFALVVSLLTVAIPLAPAGADGVVNRRQIDPGPRLLRRSIATSFAASLIVAIAGRLIYGLEASVLALLPIAITAGGVNYVAAACFQSTRRFPIALGLLQGVNVIMLAVAVLTAAAGYPTAWPALLLLTAWFALAAGASWLVLCTGQRRNGAPRESFHWREALSIVGVSGVSIVLGQLEKLLIPKVLTIEDLATYGVLAALVASIFRMMSLGVGFTLLPRLRGAESAAQRRSLVATEAAAAGAVLIVAGVVIWYVTPAVVESLLRGKYYLPPALILATLIAGTMKVASAFARSTVTALGSTRDLAYLNALSCISLGLAVCAAVVGARWGLSGVVYGVALGWLGQGLCGAALAAPLLRDAPSRPHLEVPAHQTRHEHVLRVAAQ